MDFNFGETFLAQVAVAAVVVVGIAVDVAVVVVYVMGVVADADIVVVHILQFVRQVFCSPYMARGRQRS